MLKKPGNKGFTLIELMIAIAVVAIVVNLAVPSYQNFIREARRSDARHLLHMNANRLQRCFTLEGWYNGSCVLRPLSEEGFYSMTSTITASTFVLTASPVAGSDQLADLNCTSFVLTNTGLKTATGSFSADCW